MLHTPLDHKKLEKHHKRKDRSGHFSSEYIRVLLIRTLGNFMILSSLFMIAKTFYQPIKEEARYFVNKQIDKEYVVASEQNPDEPGVIQKDYSGNAQGGLAKMFNLKKVEVLVPTNTDFSIVVPKIGANAPVLANVDAANEPEYLEALKHGVAHTKGTAFPGEGGHMFFFAHSTDYIWNVGTYNAVFYLLYKLEPGDEINIFYKGQRYVYIVRQKEIVNPDQIEYITRKTDKEFITLQTCWPPGTTLQRQLVFAERVVE